jgi:uncharacterized protein (TIGR02646 family)
MIRVVRGPAPEVLTKPFPDGATETERAIAHYTNGWDGKSAYSYTRYSEDEVRRALDAMCHGKCAYCESRIHVVTHEDVEHWRPKGSVKRPDGGEIKPGYYWLGAEWTNLLPSCPHCNRRSRKDLDAPGGALSGKQDLFPVADEGRRWRRHDAPNEEEPLLLDPSAAADRPGDYLRLDDGAVMHEKPPAGSRDNDRARETIAVYGLNRPDLVAERREHRQRVVSLLADVRRYTRWLDRADDEADRAEARAALVEKLDLLAAERAPRSPYLFLKQPLIDEFMAIWGPALARLGVP